jgi:hypothetical protein
MMQLTQFKHAHKRPEVHVSVHTSSKSTTTYGCLSYRAVYFGYHVLQWKSVCLRNWNEWKGALQLHFGLIHNFKMISSWQNVFLLHIVVFWVLAPCCILVGGYQRLGKSTLPLSSGCIQDSYEVIQKKHRVKFGCVSKSTLQPFVGSKNLQYVTNNAETDGFLKTVLFARWSHRPQHALLICYSSLSLVS